MFFGHMNISSIVQRLRLSSKLNKRLADEKAEAVVQAAQAIIAALAQGSKVMLFGNGGSAADAQHIAAEFIGRFHQERRPLPAIALTTDTSILTAVGNDYGFEQIFARQVQALGRTGDVVIAISTSGRSPNVLAGVQAAKDMGLVTIGLTGGDGDKLASLVSIPIAVPSRDTPRIQECHITIGHLLCEAVEAALEAGEIPSRSEEAHPKPKKMVGWEKLLDMRERWRLERKTVVWTNGCFDLLHIGHVKSLQAARLLGDILVVGINSDNSVRKLKGPGRPLFPAKERGEMLAALTCVDYVVIFNELTPEKVLNRLKPDIHCKGSDYAPPHGKPIPEARCVKAYGGRIEFLPLRPGHSTSELINRIQKMSFKKDYEKG